MGGQTGAEIEKISTKRLADYFWHQRACPVGDPLTDWHCAEKANSELRQYLSVLAALAPKALGDFLDAESARRMNSQQATLVILVARDGAPEYARHRYAEARRISPNNGVHPEHGIRKREKEFAELCMDHILQHRLVPWGGVKATDSEAIGDQLRSVAKQADERPFEDGLVAFAPATEFRRVVITAVGLCRRLMTQSEEGKRSWDERLHARIGLGLNGFSAARCLTFAWRNEVVADRAALPNDLSNDFKRLAMAAGVSFLPSSGINVHGD
jgi:hypothetical protein